MNSKLGLVLVSVGVLGAALAACGGSTSTPAVSGEAGADATTTDGAPSTDEGGSATTDGGGGGTTDGGGGGGSTTDGPRPVIPEGGKPSEPTTVDCAGTACPVATTECCITQGPNNQPQAACIPKGTACPNGATVACDEAANCAPGQICCAVATFQPFTIKTECQTPVKGRCTGGDYSIQACRTNPECTNASPCVVNHCPQRDIEVCGDIPTCQQ